MVTIAPPKINLDKESKLSKKNLGYYCTKSQTISSREDRDACLLTHPPVELREKLLSIIFDFYNSTRKYVILEKIATFQNWNVDDTHV